MTTETKFFADATLAGLARWLRLLGFDTVCFQGKAGRPLMRQAAAEGRILLTRRRDLLERQFSGRLILLPGTTAVKQLSFALGKLSLEIQAQNLYTLCLSCNQKLISLERESVRDLVPEYVFEHCSVYTRCPQCRKIFWPGTHRRNALKFLKDNGFDVT
ncbi:MAG TPA: Mut7-C RNAse domain-containing protein [Smithellaceae bacterium]|nr:Mut7-C RNAse domain-containing protein [Smithellaceae bacterium]HOH56820.1 Mut7-C RNAse domain-containing protein [Smithellaceae bacterium]HPV71455.1 Mut7-C RNAse domain-containing protein [Smithellaceae bacterium]HPY06140.1 Mut7-C RNAse domain-containing protein [Smithellaceae bacterium]HQC09312.1 Mut7-C RNAse domain-containing protein [Smithellaceae bacterium]